MRLTPLKERSGLTQVPGTVVLADTVQGQDAGIVDANLKRNKKGDIILAPQPLDDPNDPLNWPIHKKLSIVIILMFGSCLCAATIGPLLTPSLLVIAADLGRPLTDITITAGCTLLAAGCSGFLVSVIACKFGKRPAFLFCSAIGVVGSVVGAAIHTYEGLLAARILQGFATCAYEALVISIVGDIFFVHERGLYASCIIFTLNCVSNLSPIVCGPIADRLGWQWWLFTLLAIVISVQLILCFLFVPETTYDRERHSRKDEETSTNLTEVGKSRHEHQEVAVGSTAGTEKSPNSVSTTATPKQKTWIQEWKVYNGIMSPEPVWSLFIAPLLTCANIAVLWMVVATGVVTCFYVAQSYVAAQIFSPPPYLLNVSQVGYTFLGPFIGGLIGTLIVGTISDSIVMQLTKHNRGVYEPEFRLVPIVIALSAGAGFFGFGYACAEQMSVYKASFLWGLCVFGITFIVVPASAYIMDAFRELSHEAFIAAMIFKNFLFYGFSHFMNNWLASAGPAIPFYIFGGITFGLILTTIVVFMWGKRYRNYWSRHNVFEKLNIRSQAEF